MVSIYRVKGGDKHMNEISQLSVVRISLDASGKERNKNVVLQLKH